MHKQVLYEVGKQVEVLWKRSWYSGTVVEVHNDRVHVRFRTSIGEDPTYEWIETSSDGLKEVSRPRRTQGGGGGDTRG